MTPGRVPSWQRAFDDPIPLPDGCKLITLPDTANYIMKLPKRERDALEWQAAIEALMLVARGGPTLRMRDAEDHHAIPARRSYSLESARRNVLNRADSARCRPRFRNDLAHRSDLMSPAIPR
ncbi:hypothetical protein [Bradyrhizobium sp. USDA 4502]